jgi:hypothetical protein
MQTENKKDLITKINEEAKTKLGSPGGVNVESVDVENNKVKTSFEFLGSPRELVLSVEESLDSAKVEAKVKEEKEKVVKEIVDEVNGVDFISFDSAGLQPSVSVKLVINPTAGGGKKIGEEKITVPNDKAELQKSLKEFRVKSLVDAITLLPLDFALEPDGENQVKIKNGESEATLVNDLDHSKDNNDLKEDILARVSALEKALDIKNFPPSLAKKTFNIGGKTFGLEVKPVASSTDKREGSSYCSKVR